MANAVARLMSPWACRHSLVTESNPVAPPGDDDLVIEDVGGASPAGAWALSCGGAVVATVTRVEDLLLAVQHWLDQEVLRRATANLLPVHAGAVEWRGRVIVLPGASASGKTRLVSALVRRGAGYCSDEFAFLDAEGRVHPYPRHHVLRDETGVRRSTPLPAAARVVTAPARVGAIIGLEFDPGGAWHVTPIAASDAVLLLLAHTPHRISIASGVPRQLISAASGCVALRGWRASAEEAADHVLRLAESW